MYISSPLRDLDEGELFPFRRQYMRPTDFQKLNHKKMSNSFGRIAKRWSVYFSYLVRAAGGQKLYTICMCMYGMYIC